MIGYLVGGAALVAIGAGGIAAVQTQRLESLKIENTVVEGQLSTCAGRLDSILRDVESDNEIDNLDLTDFDIPADWMRPGAAPSN